MSRLRAERRARERIRQAELLRLHHAAHASEIAAAQQQVGERAQKAGRRPAQHLPRHAIAQGLPPELVEKLWRRLIDWSIAREESVLGPDSLRGEKPE